MSVYLGNTLVSTNGGLTAAGAVDLFYPVGSIYLSVNSTNPSSIFGGTWVAFGAGRVLVGVDANDEDFESAMLDGGEKTVALSYQLEGIKPTVEEATGYGLNMVNGFKDRVVVIGDGPGSLNNLQPYITCYMWRRTA